MFPVEAGLFALQLPDRWVESLLSTAVAFLIPLLLAGVGECLAERSGVLNIGVEGLMLAGALAAVAASWATGSAWVGMLAALGTAVVLGAAFASLAVYRRVDQVVAGTALNLLAMGLTGAVFFTLNRWVAEHGGSRLVGVKLPDWPLPLVRDLPLLGPILFRSNLLVYLALASVPAAAWWLWRTRPGLALRATGESAGAAAAAGIPVRRTRFLATLVGAGLAGLGGAFLSVGHVPAFAENMTAGKGFIALALVIFGRWNPWGILGGGLVFALATGMTTVLATQGRGRPEEVLLLALPYVVTLAALLFRSGRSHAPAGLAQPY